MSWSEYRDNARGHPIKAHLGAPACQACPSKPLCTRTKTQGRQLSLHPREAHEALAAARARQARDEERHLYRLRAGIEGTLSQGVRAFGLRQARYRGLAKMHLQTVATAVALNVDRLAAWLEHGHWHQRGSHASWLWPPNTHSPTVSEPMAGRRCLALKFAHTAARAGQAGLFSCPVRCCSKAATGQAFTQETISTGMPIERPSSWSARP